MFSQKHPERCLTKYLATVVQPSCHIKLNIVEGLWEALSCSTFTSSLVAGTFFKHM